MNNNTRSWNIVSGWSKCYFHFKTYKKSDISGSTFWYILPCNFIKSNLWKWLLNVLAEISDFICFKIKVVFTPSSYNIFTPSSYIIFAIVCSSINIFVVRLLQFFSHVFILASNTLEQNTRFASHGPLIKPTCNTSKYGTNAFVASAIASWNFFQKEFPSNDMRQISYSQLKVLIKN